MQILQILGRLILRQEDTSIIISLLIVLVGVIMRKSVLRLMLFILHSGLLDFPFPHPF